MRLLDRVGMAGQSSVCPSSVCPCFQRRILISAPAGYSLNNILHMKLLIRVIQRPQQCFENKQDGTMKAFLFGLKSERMEDATGCPGTKNRHCVASAAAKQSHRGSHLHETIIF